MLPVISTSLLTLSFSLEVSPVSWNMRPSSALSVKLPLWPCRQPRTLFCAFDELAAPLCGMELLLWLVDGYVLLCAELL